MGMAGEVFGERFGLATDANGGGAAESCEAVVDFGEVGLEEAVVVASPGLGDVVGLEIGEELLWFVVRGAARGPLA